MVNPSFSWTAVADGEAAVIDAGARADGLPPPPEQPMPGECCGRGCVNCVWVYYELALERWKQRCEEIRAGRIAESAGSDHGAGR